MPHLGAAKLWLLEFLLTTPPRDRGHSCFTDEELWLEEVKWLSEKVFPFPLSWSTAKRWLSFYWKAYSGQPGVSTSIFGGNSSPLSIELSSYDSSLKVGQKSPYSFSIMWEQQLRSYWSPGHLLAQGEKHSPRNKTTVVTGNFSHFLEALYKSGCFGIYPPCNFFWLSLSGSKLSLPPGLAGT